MGHAIRAVTTVAILAVIPLLMAITILFPADADEPAETPPVTMTNRAGDEDAGFDVTLDTGTVVVLSGSVISAKTVTVTTAPDEDATD